MNTVFRLTALTAFLILSSRIVSASPVQISMDSPPLNPGTFAPHFTTKTTFGQPFDSKQLLGHITVLDFWATWCLPCREEMPYLEKISEDYAKHNVQVIGMSGDTYTISAVIPTLEQLHITYTNMADTHSCLKIEDAYNAEPLPSIYIIDQKGIVRFSESGQIDDKTLRKILDSIIKSK